MGKKWSMQRRAKFVANKWINKTASNMGMGVSVKKTAQWDKARDLLSKLPMNVQIAIDATIQDEAKLFIDMAKRTVLSGGTVSRRGWSPNKPVTLHFKKGKAPLSDTKALANSMYLKRERLAQYRLMFRGGGGRSAHKMHSIAMTHEHGAKIVRRPTGAEMRAIMAKMAAAGVSGERNKTRKKKGYIVIRIPKRPFLRDTKSAYFTGKGFKARVRTKIRANMAKYNGMISGGN